jgi:hypothetical protein
MFRHSLRPSVHPGLHRHGRTDHRGHPCLEFLENRTLLATASPVVPVAVLGSTPAQAVNNLPMASSTIPLPVQVATLAPTVTELVSPTLTTPLNSQASLVGPGSNQAFALTTGQPGDLLPQGGLVSPLTVVSPLLPVSPLRAFNRFQGSGGGDNSEIAATPAASRPTLLRVPGSTRPGGTALTSSPLLQTSPLTQPGVPTAPMPALQQRPAPADSLPSVLSEPSGAAVLPVGRREATETYFSQPNAWRFDAQSAEKPEVMPSVEGNRPASALAAATAICVLLPLLRPEYRRSSTRTRNGEPWLQMAGYDSD